MHVSSSTSHVSERQLVSDEGAARKLKAGGVAWSFRIATNAHLSAPRSAGSLVQDSAIEFACRICLPLTKKEITMGGKKKSRTAWYCDSLDVSWIALRTTLHSPNTRRKAGEAADLLTQDGRGRGKWNCIATNICALRQCPNKTITGPQVKSQVASQRVICCFNLYEFRYWRVHHFYGKRIKRL